MTFSSEDYWIERGASYRDKFRRNPAFAMQERVLIDYLRTLTFGSVLEVGCGFGRITRLVQDAFAPSRYTAFDLSSDQAAIAQDAVPEVLIEQGSLFKLDFVIPFDLVLATEVLMHIEPARLPEAIARLCSWGHNVVTVDWRVDPPPDTMAAHNFHHDYERLYAEHGSVETIAIGNGQAIFHCKPRVVG